MFATTDVQLATKCLIRINEQLAKYRYHSYCLPRHSLSRYTEVSLLKQNTGDAAAAHRIWRLLQSYALCTECRYCSAAIYSETLLVVESYVRPTHCEGTTQCVGPTYSLFKFYLNFINDKECVLYRDPKSAWRHLSTSSRPYTLATLRELRLRCWPLGIGITFWPCWTNHKHTSRFRRQ